MPSRLQPEGITRRSSERNIFVRNRFGTCSCGWRFRCWARQSLDEVGANAPERDELRGFRLLGFAVLVFLLPADKLSVNKDMVALAEPVGDAELAAIDDGISALESLLSV
jgi:hypothetical protein